MRRIVLFFVFNLFASSTIAGGSVEGKITKIRVDHPSGQAMIYFDADVSISGANCRGGGYKNALAVDASTEGGKAVLSAALAAKAAGMTVRAVGKYDCNVYGNGVAETLDNLQIQ